VDKRLILLTFGVVLALSSADAPAAPAIQVIRQQPRPAAPSARYYLAVGGHADDRAHCAFLHNSLQLAARGPVETECGRVGDEAASRERRDSGRFAYRVESSRLGDGAIRLRFDNWAARTDDTEFTTTGATISGGPEQQRLVQRRVERLVEYDRSERALKETLLAGGTAESRRVTLGRDGKYRDRSTGRELGFDDAYALYQDEGPRQKHFLRAGLELFALLGAGTIWYQAEAELNSRDWEYEYDWASFRTRFLTTDATRFDSNYFGINTMHAYSGAAYYLVARQNGLNALEAFLMATAASTLWEFVVEFREKISINDMIVTPVAGMAIGEVFTQLGAFFDRGSDNVLTRALGLIFGGPRQLHNWLDNNRPRRTTNVDGLGFTRDVWHQFQLFAGAGIADVRRSVGGSQVARESRGEVHLGLETLLVNVPEYGRPGRVSRLLTDGNFSQMILRMSASAEGVTDFLFFAKAALLGYYRQDIRGQVDAQGNAMPSTLQGYSFFVGAASAFEHSSHARGPGEESDQLAIVNVLGPTMELVYHYRGLRVKATLDVFGDFAMVRSYAIDRMIDEGGRVTVAGAKSTLLYTRYYYAFGLTVAPRVSVAYRGFELGGELRFDGFRSIEGLDRFQERVTNDFPLTDTRLVARVWLSYTLPGDWLRLSLVGERSLRAGSVEGYDVSTQETRLYANMAVLF
jgi:hypothetical protein